MNTLNRSKATQNINFIANTHKGNGVHTEELTEGSKES